MDTSFILTIGMYYKVSITDINLTIPASEEKKGRRREKDDTRRDAFGSSPNWSGPR